MNTADKERIFYVISIFFLLWAYPNFSPALAIYYTAFTIVGY